MPDVDLRSLRPSELIRLLNSTPLGQVLQTHTMFRGRRECRNCGHRFSTYEQET